MTDTNSIAPPRELVQEWIAEIWHEGTPVQVAHSDLHIATRAAQWGADQELEACIVVLSGQWEWGMLSQCTGWKEFRDESEKILRVDRRPKPPSLAEQACKLLECYGTSGVRLTADQCNTILRALKALPNG